MPGIDGGDERADVRPRRGDRVGSDIVSRLESPPAQLPLPAFRRTLRGDDEQFAHPAEREFARLLSFHRIRWAYEPTTFAIDWAADGRPCGFFTPDFYLPGQGLYVELTTMRQPLVTRKNRKLRRLRELYPNVRIKVLYKRDLQRLQLAYLASDGDRLRERVGEILFSEGAIEARLRSLVEQIADEWMGWGRDGDPPVLLGVGRGSARTLGAFTEAFRRIGLRVEPERIAVARYRGASVTTRIRMCHQPASLVGRRVLVIEDVVSSGLSLESVTAWLAKRGVAEWRTCALLDRRGARLIDVPLAWSAFAAPDDLLVGFGLALRREFSGLPYIARLDRRFA